MHEALEWFLTKALLRLPYSDMIYLFKRILPKEGNFCKIDPIIYKDEVLKMTFKELCTGFITRKLKIKSTWEEVKELFTKLEIRKATVKVSKRVIEFKCGVVLIRIPYVELPILLEEMKTMHTKFYVMFKHFAFVPVPLYLNLEEGFSSHPRIEVDLKYAPNIEFDNAIGKITNLEESGYKEIEEKGIVDAAYINPVTRIVLRFLVGLEDVVVYRGFQFPRKLLGHAEQDYVYKALRQLG